MHELDQMTPNQRLNAFMTGQAMDRMLAMPVIVSMSGDLKKRSSANGQPYTGSSGRLSSVYRKRTEIET